jgi:LuxR family maltose regulon positive regulatory protein
MYMRGWYALPPPQFVREWALMTVGTPSEREQAIRRADELHLLRTVLDCGPTIYPLLVMLAQRGVAPAYMQRLLPLYNLAQPQLTHVPSVTLVREMPTLLTRREHEILELLAQRWTDKEIAEQLVIAPNTVRKHTSTIYSKLGVSSRREAVEVAQSLRLL